MYNTAGSDLSSRSPVSRVQPIFIVGGLIVTFIFLFFSVRETVATSVVAHDSDYALTGDSQSRFQLRDTRDSSSIDLNGIKFQSAPVIPEVTFTPIPTFNAQASGLVEPTATPIQVLVKMPTATPVATQLSAPERETTNALAGEEAEDDIEWLDDLMVITHYTFALESDPIYANDPLVAVPGLDQEDRFRQGFVYGGRGIIQQGTGKTADGRYISIDWSKSTFDTADYTNNQWHFSYGIGRPVLPWRTVAAKHVNLPPGTMIMIEAYQDLGVFVVNDSGLDLEQNQIDIFVGEMTIEEAERFGRKLSRIAIVEP